MKKSEILFGALRLPVDFLAAVSAFLLAYTIRPITDLIPGVQYVFGYSLLPPFPEFFKFTLISSGVLILLFAVSHLYALKARHRFWSEAARIFFLISAWILFIIAYYFLVIHQLFFSRIALAHIWLFTVLFVCAGRGLISLIQNLFLRFGIGRRRTLFIGANVLADRFYHQISSDHSYSVIGALAEHRLSRKSGLLRIIGTLDELEPTVRKHHVEEIIVADPDLENEIASGLHDFCRSHQISYHFIPDLIRLQRTNVEVQMVGNIPLISLRETSLDGWGKVFKRTFDFVGSLILLFLLSPLFFLIAVVIRADSKGSFFYKSCRQYRDTIFNVYKFRSMVCDAEELKKNLLAQNERSGPMFKITHDPRVTRVGRFLRKTSLDELPQLFNVLIGNMSLVGPRPHLPEEIGQYQSHHYQVFAIKPGITGLAQISGRSHLDFEQEVKLDVYYIENWSLWLDVKILLKSVAVVFRADGV